MKESIRWFRLAAEDGDLTAQQALGSIYEKGDESIELLPDHQEALRLYKSAALQGLQSAQYELGRRYHKGKCGVKVDFVEARRWFKLAADQGCLKSRKLLQTLDQSHS